MFLSSRFFVVELGDTASPSELSPGHDSTCVVFYFVLAYAISKQKTKLIAAIANFSCYPTLPRWPYFRSMIILVLRKLRLKPA